MSQNTRFYMAVAGSTLLIASFFVATGKAANDILSASMCALVGLGLWSPSILDQIKRRRR